METRTYSRKLNGEKEDPHSLGILIEWKPLEDAIAAMYESGSKDPHSLGILIEWKHLPIPISLVLGLTALDPHSLGILIEWKPQTRHG